MGRTRVKMPCVGCNQRKCRENLPLLRVKGCGPSRLECDEKRRRWPEGVACLFVATRDAPRTAGRAAARVRRAGRRGTRSRRHGKTSRPAHDLRVPTANSPRADTSPPRHERLRHRFPALYPTARHHETGRAMIHAAPSESRAVRRLWRRGRCDGGRGVRHSHAACGIREAGHAGAAITFAQPVSAVLPSSPQARPPQLARRNRNLHGIGRPFPQACSPALAVPPRRRPSRWPHLASTAIVASRRPASCLRKHHACSGARHGPAVAPACASAKRGPQAQSSTHGARPATQLRNRRAHGSAQRTLFRKTFRIALPAPHASQRGAITKNARFHPGAMWHPWKHAEHSERTAAQSCP